MSDSGAYSRKNITYLLLGVIKSYSSQFVTADG